jgi:hypothetical protein
MKVSGQLHALAAFPSRRSPLVLTEVKLHALQTMTEQFQLCEWGIEV